MEHRGRACQSLQFCDVFLRFVGAEIRDGIKSVNKDGVCHETDWPYDVDKFTEKPPRDCYLSAKVNQ